MADILSKLKILLPKRAKPKGTAVTSTYNADNPKELLSAPEYREHLQNIFSDRQSQTSQELLETLFESDPDMSAAVNAFLTTADIEPLILVLDAEGQVDREGYRICSELLERLTVRRDYSKGFMRFKSLRVIAEEMRYMVLLRGGIAAEAVFDELLTLSEIRQVDLKSIKWQEPEPGRVVPFQDTGGGDPVPLDIPTFFVEFFRKAPNRAYSTSVFVSAINTIAARQQVINDLYRIMQVTGYPRITIKILEEVVARNAPANVRNDPVEFRRYLNARRSELAGQFAALRADQPIAHYDSAEIKILNDKNPGMALDITAIINVLNAQNQAGLRSMATILGRGESGVNTATVEARIFALNAEAINGPVGDLLSRVLTMALRLQGSESRVVVRYPEVELRSEMELEAQLNLKANRLRQDLSDGLITDDEYHLWMYRRLRPDAAPELSGTGFMDSGGAIDAGSVSPNSDPLGRSVSSATDKAAKSNSNKSKPKK